MGDVVRVNGIQNLPRAIERGNRNIKKAVDAAIWRTAQRAKGPIRRRTPKAFGELRESVDAYRRGPDGNPVTAVRAPHATAVEIGSRPHFPNFDKILAWVKLRGIQGLTGAGKIRTRYRIDQGPTTKFQAMRIASLFKKLEVRGKKGVGRHSPANAAEQVALRICKHIEKRGTPPFRFVMASLPEIRDILSEEMQKSMARVKG